MCHVENIGGQYPTRSTIGVDRDFQGLQRYPLPVRNKKHIYVTIIITELCDNMEVHQVDIDT